MYFWLKPKVPKVHPKGSGSSEQGGLAWTAALPPQDARDRPRISCSRVNSSSVPSMGRQRCFLDRGFLPLGAPRWGRRSLRLRGGVAGDREDLLKAFESLREDIGQSIRRRPATIAWTTSTVRNHLGPPSRPLPGFGLIELDTEYEYIPLGSLEEDVAATGRYTIVRCITRPIKGHGSCVRGRGRRRHCAADEHRESSFAAWASRRRVLCAPTGGGASCAGPTSQVEPLGRCSPALPRAPGASPRAPDRGPRQARRSCASTTPPT